MEPIQIFKKTEDENETIWEYTVLLGHDSDEVGFLVKVGQEYWLGLTSRRASPEQLIKQSFRFLLQKHSKYSIPKSFDLREIHERFTEYERQVTRPSFSWFEFGLEVPDEYPRDFAAWK